MAISSSANVETSQLPVCLVTGGSGLLGHALQSVLSRPTPADTTAPQHNCSSPPPSSASPPPSSSSPPPSSGSSSSLEEVEKHEDEEKSSVRAVQPPPLSVIEGETFLFVFVSSVHADLRWATRKEDIWPCACLSGDREHGGETERVLTPSFNYVCEVPRKLDSIEGQPHLSRVSGRTWGGYGEKKPSEVRSSLTCFVFFL